MAVQAEKKISNSNDMVYNALKSKIINLDYRFGEKLRDEDLISKFGVSRTPIREALTRLEQDGFVYNIPNVGYFLKKISLNDIKELYYVRGLLEIPATKLAMKAMDNERIKRLEKIVNKGRSLLKKGNLDNYTEVSWEYHKDLVFYSGNKLLYQVFTKLSEKLIMAARIGLRKHEMLIESQEEHEAMLDCIETGEHKLMIKKLKNHIKRAERNTFRSIMENTDSLFL